MAANDQDPQTLAAITAAITGTAGVVTAWVTHVLGRRMGTKERRENNRDIPAQLDRLLDRVEKLDEQSTLQISKLSDTVRSEAGALYKKLNDATADIAKVSERVARVETRMEDWR
jgi:hypothetical protein